jgi:hypothetical protein
MDAQISKTVRVLLFVILVTAHGQCGPVLPTMSQVLDTYIAQWRYKKFKGCKPKLVGSAIKLISTGKTFEFDGVTYDLDPAFLVAIANLETQLGVDTDSDFNPFNVWTYTGKPHVKGDSSYTSWPQGINEITKKLHLRYMVLGYDSLPLFACRYAGWDARPAGSPLDRTHLRAITMADCRAKTQAGTWIPAVSQIYRQIRCLELADLTYHGPSIPEVSFPCLNPRSKDAVIRNKIIPYKLKPEVRKEAAMDPPTLPPLLSSLPEILIANSGTGLPRLQAPATPPDRGTQGKDIPSKPTSTGEKRKGRIRRVLLRIRHVFLGF